MTKTNTNIKNNQKNSDMKVYLEMTETMELIDTYF